MNLSEKVGEYAEKNNETRDSIADKLGISRSSFFNKVRGSYEFSLSEAYKLSRLLGVSLDTMCSTLRAAYREWERKEGSKGQ